MIEHLDVGNFVFKDDRQYEIVKINGHKITLVDSITDNQLIIKISELNDQILLGKVRITFSDEKKQKLHGEHAMDFASYSKELKKEALEKWAYVNALRQSDITTYTDASLAPLIKEINESTGIKAPNWRTLKRWYDNAKSYGIRGLIEKRHLKGNREDRVDSETNKYIISALERLKKSEKISYKKAHLFYTDEIDIENAGRELDKQLSSLTYQGFINRAKKVAPYELLASQIGKQRADVLFRENKRNKPVKYILDRAEIDHTRLDLFVVDEIARFPLGRPNITSVLDMKSKSVLGFYIGFEVPSFVSVSRAIKNAISDKTELLKRYPAVKNDWLCKGLFHEIAYDRGREFDSNLLENSLLDLDIVGRGNPVKKPWYKGSVESHFNTLNKKLLVDKPGKAFTDILDSNEYKPQENGVISFTKFMEIFMIWVVDEYQAGPNSTETAIPNLTWRKDLPFVDVTPISPEKLDIVFSEQDTRKNKEKGIEYTYLFYDNDRLSKMRKRHGFRLEQIKINREDLGYLYVLDQVTREYFKVPALDQDYAKGLTLYQHKRILKFHKKYIKSHIDSLALAEARKRIEDIIQDEIKNTRRSKTATLAGIARFLGMDQHQDGPATVLRSGNAGDLPPRETMPTDTNEDFINDYNNVEDDLNDEME
jgi:putative transposase